MEQNRKHKLHFTLAKDLNVTNIECNRYSHPTLYNLARTYMGEKKASSTNSTGKLDVYTWKNETVPVSIVLHKN